MKNFAEKHPVITGHIFSLIILYWMSLGNLSPLVINRFNLSYSVKSVLFSLIISMFASNIFLYLSIVPGRVNAYEILLNALLPVFVFYMLKLIEYNFGMVIFALVLMLIAAVLIYALQKYFRVKKIRMVYFLRHIVSVVAALLIIPCCQYYHYTDASDDYVNSSYIYEDPYIVDGAYYEEYDRLKRDLHKCDWYRLPGDEKKNMISRVIECEAKALGITPPDFGVEDLDPETYNGYYNHGTKTIVISEHKLLSENIGSVLRVVGHELYHAFQRSVVDIVKQLDKSEYGENSYFKKASLWTDAQDSYSEDKKTERGYYENALEVDAREFEEELAAKYGFD